MAKSVHSKAPVTTQGLIPKHSPWGWVDSRKALDDGGKVFDVTTASHGGIMVEFEYAKSNLSPEGIEHGEVFYDRGGSGQRYVCFEEDCDWAIPIFELVNLRERFLANMVPESEMRKDFDTYLHNHLSSWHGRYLLKRGIAPEPERYARYLKFQEEIHNHR